MFEISLDKDKLNIDLNDKVKALKKLNYKGEDLALELASNIANDARTLAYERYFNKKYSEGSHNSLFLGTNKMRKDKKGRRLVNFSLSQKSSKWKVATVTAYPMNLYEHDTKPYSKPNPYIPMGHVRPGTNIIRQKLPPQIASLVPKSESKFMKKLIIEAGKLGV